MVFFNFLGVGFFVGAVVIGMLLNRFVTGDWLDPGAVGFLSAGFCAIAIDLGYRAKQIEWEGHSRFIQPTSGGQLFFIPIWVFGMSSAWFGSFWEDSTCSKAKVLSERGTTHS